MIENDICLIDILPDEILEGIFGFLNVIDLKKDISLVCKRWYMVSKSFSLLKDLKLGPNINTETAVKLLQEAPLLTSLQLLSRKDANELLIEITSSNSKLENLKITSNKDARYTEIESQCFLTCIGSLRNLKHLTLKRVTFDNPEDVYNELGPSVRKLVTLNLNHSIQLDTESLTALVRGLPCLKEFRIYCISFNRIGSVTPYTDAPVEELTRKMGDTLQVLKLNMLGLTGAVFHVLSEMPRLRVLHLYRMVMVQDESLVLIRRLKNLEKLMVTIPRTISSHCWSETISSLTLLTMIIISNSYTVDDQLLKTIADNCPSIEELGFPGCRAITDEGVSEVFIKCHLLIKMNLFSTKSVVAEAFRLIPANLPAMELLIYRAVDRSETDFPEEVKAMPNLVTRSIYRYP